MTDIRSHWDQRYQAGDTGLSWFEARPGLSLELIREAAPGKKASVIDVGGGVSRLSDALLEAGYSDITVLDVSDAALARSKARLGPRAQRVHWILADITRWAPERRWDVWHDRAMFHFLTGEAEQKAYLTALERFRSERNRFVIPKGSRVRFKVLAGMEAGMGWQDLFRTIFGNVLLRRWMAERAAGRWRPGSTLRCRRL